MSAGMVAAFALALVSTTLSSLAYLREHDAAAAMPALSMRRPLQSLQALLGDRSWLLGFAMEGGAFALYAAALALAPLALVQSIAAGGIGLLAFFSIRLSGGRLGLDERAADPGRHDRARRAGALRRTRRAARARVRRRHGRRRAPGAT
jgi:hypothetical protein